MSLQDFLKQLKAAPIWSEPKTLKRGAFLCQAGDLCQDVILVEEGCLHFYLLDDGEEQSIRFAYPGNIVSSLDSYISGEPSKYYLQTLRKLGYRSCSKSDFEDYIKREGLLEQWTQSLHYLLLEMMEREQDLLIKNPASRLKRVLSRSPQLFQEVPFKYIASYLRMSPETLSRLMNS